MVFFIVGFIASIIGAISGLGGGIIIKPVLDAVTELDASVINFLSTCAVFTMSCSAVTKHIKYKTKFEKPTTVLLGIGAILGGLIGTEIFEFIVDFINKDRFIKLIQNGLLLSLLVIILVYINLPNKKQFHIKNRIFTVLLGYTLGMISSFLGIGGGPINITALTLFFSMNLKSASVNSIILILFSQASKIITLLISKSIPSGLEISMLLYIIPAAILGGIFGTTVNKKINKSNLIIAYNSVMLFVIMTCLWNIIRLF